MRQLIATTRERGWVLLSLMLLLLGACTTLDKEQFYLSNEGIRFYDPTADKWKLWSAKAAPFFLTCDSGMLVFDEKGRGIVDKRVIEIARNAPESRHASDDPEGHWGPVVNGFQVGIRLETNLFAASNVWAAVVARNVSETMGHVRYSDPDSPASLAIRNAAGDVVQPGPEAPPRTFAERLGKIRNNGEQQEWVLPGTQRQWKVRLRNSNKLPSGTYRISAATRVGFGSQKDYTEAHSGMATITLRR